MLGLLIFFANEITDTVYYYYIHNHIITAKMNYNTMYNYVYNYLHIIS